MKGSLVSRIGLFAALALLVAVLLSVVVQPVEAANTLRFTLEAGRHEVRVDDQTLIIETNRDLVVRIQAEDGFIEGVIEAARASDVAHVVITLVGPPDRVIFGGDVSGPTTFDSSSPEETGASDE